MNPRAKLGMGIGALTIYFLHLPLSLQPVSSGTIGLPVNTKIQGYSSPLYEYKMVEYSQPSVSMDVKPKNMEGWLYIYWKKNPCVSGTTQFKPLFKGQLMFCCPIYCTPQAPYAWLKNSIDLTLSSTTTVWGPTSIVKIPMLCNSGPTSVLLPSFWKSPSEVFEIISQGDLYSQGCKYYEI